MPEGPKASGKGTEDAVDKQNKTQATAGGTYTR